jgi:RecB family exonuclease
VFVPGLAERMFPHKVIDDPLLLDHVRAALGLELMTRAGRVDDERLALRLAIGAASKRAVLSYPRIDLDQGRPRVPSFYGLEVLEAAEGQLPGFDELGKKADVTGAARIGWPAPAESELAIDEAEHDLALLDGLLRPHPGSARDGLAREDAPTGTAAYLLAANPHLGRTLRFRARRWTIQSWKPADGLVTGSDAGRAALAEHALERRSFSPTALEQLAHCPYRFALRTILKLEPREQPEPIEALGPLERGSLFHDIMFELMSELRDAGELPITGFDAVRERIDRVLARVAARYRDDLCPAIDRVWDDGIEAIGADVREHVRRSVDDLAWIPRRFELAFGLPGSDGRDPASVDEPVELGIGISLRGSIDLVEESVDGVLRATDYKTGAARAKANTVIGNGTALQPVLYALVLERLFAGAKVGSGRLSYCTSKGEFRVVEVALDQAARDAAALLSSALGEHFARGLFPAAPAKGACQYCDFRLICGPYEEHRARTKLKHEPLVQLQKLRDHR